MDKETLSNYGWIVICVLVLAVMIALATPFGDYISTAVKSTTQGLFDTNKNALNSTGLINIGDQSFSDGTGGSGSAETPITPVAYEIIEGAGQTVATTDASFRSTADYNKFESVKVDNNIVNPSNYSVSEGSTIINFKGEYFATLSNGTHKLEVVSIDGSASCEFTVNLVSKPEIIEYLGVIRTPDFGDKYTFIYKPGMTWAEYVNSSYNNGLFSIDASGYVICNKPIDFSPVGNDTLVKETDIIEYPATYTFRPDKTITRNDLFDCSSFGGHLETIAHNGYNFCLHCGKIAE